MKIKAKFFASIRNLTSTAETEVEVENATVGDVLDVLVTKYGDKFREGVLDVDGTVKKSIRVLLNGNFIDRDDPLIHEISEGDTVYLFPPTVGA